MKRRTVVALMSVLVLSACGGDGGSNTPSASEWADNLCTDLSTWRSSVAAVGDSLQAGNLEQAELQNAATEVEDATETLVGDLQDLGAPDVEEGQQAEDAVNQLADELQRGIGEIQRAAESASSPAEAAQAAAAVSDTFAKMGNEVSSTLSGLDQGELRSALTQDETCNDLTRS